MAMSHLVQQDNYLPKQFFWRDQLFDKTLLVWVHLAGKLMRQVERQGAELGCQNFPGDVSQPTFGVGRWALGYFV